MTVVATLSVENCPIIIGDLLLSGLENPEKICYIPSIGDTSEVFPIGSGYTIVGVRQKINIISENLVIGWAGSEIEAQSILTEILKKGQNDLFTLDSLRAFFEEATTWIRQGVNFVGFIKESRGIRQFYYSWENQVLLFDSQSFGEVQLCGTGSRDVKSYLEQFSNPLTAKMGKPNLLEKAVSSALQMTGYFLQNEITSYSNLYEWYGGGYEVATFFDKKFQKIDDITYLFWQAKVSRERIDLTLPSKAFKYSYLKDILIVRSVTLDHGNERNITVSDDSIHIIGPAYRHLKEQELKLLNPPDLNSKFICNYILVQCNENQMIVLSRVDFCPRKDRLIRFTEYKEEIILSFEHHFIEEIMDSLKSLC